LLQPQSRIILTRADALSTATDDDQSDNPFIEQHSRKFKRYAKRKMDSSLSPPKTDQQQHQSKTAVSVKRNTRQAVYGCSCDGAGIAAANKLIKKAVYCIDNIDVSYNVEDIVRHVGPKQARNHCDLLLRSQTSQSTFR
jgi:hypothetical protein